MGFSLDFGMSVGVPDLGPLAQTIANLASYWNEAPETELEEPYSEEVVRVGDYIQRFGRGQKIEQGVLPLDVLGIYRIKGSGQLQIFFDGEIDRNAVAEALDESELEVKGDHIKKDGRSILKIGKQHMTITAGMKTWGSAHVLECIEWLYNSGVVVSGQEEGLSISQTPGVMMQQMQVLDHRLGTRLETIHKIEGRLTTEQRLEMRQHLAIKLTPVLQMDHQQVAELAEELEMNQEDLMQEARRVERRIMGQLASRMMKELPAKNRPKDFKTALKMAYRMSRKLSK